MDESVNKPVHLPCCLIVSQTVFSCLLSKKDRLEHFFTTVCSNNKPRKNCTFLLSDFLTKYKFINGCNIECSLSYIFIP